jgi:hypothetical protein
VKPLYIARPIGSVKALAVALGLTEQVLRDFAKTAAEQYSFFSIPKGEDSFRDICSPSHDLKIIQKRINRSIFGCVKYPDYLFGGIKGRDYVKNATHHESAKCLIALDVKNFYPSIKYAHVLNIFKYFCKFPDEVARLLADLTTLNGVVPQGACTSSHIANLVFFDIEHRLVRELREKRLRYSRLLDDICISADRKLSEKNVDYCITRVAGLLSARNFKIKNKKTRVVAHDNPMQLMEVTGLWLNRGKPRVKKAERLDIRSELYRCEKNAGVSRFDPDFHKEHSHISGRVAKLTHLNHFEAPDFRERLRKILPLYGQLDTVKTKRLVSILARTRVTDRSKCSYIDRYFKTVYRVNIMSRSNKSLAKELRKKLAHCFPTKKKVDVIYG